MTEERIAEVQRLARYRVIGTIELTRYCGCDECLGHTHETEVFSTVVAVNEEEAVAKCLDNHSRDFDEARWAEAPATERYELAEDEVMRLMGAPVLPGMEAA